MATKKVDTAIFEITLQEAIELLRHIPYELSVMLWGAPGIGKTKVIEQLFQSVGCEVIPVLAGCSEPTDFLGIPFSQEGKYARYLAPEWAYRCSTIAPKEDQGPKVIFLDDVVTAHEQTQAALYKMTHERRIGELLFRTNVRIIAAGNRIEDKSAAQDMPMALGNRFVHLFIKVDKETWESWAQKNGIHPLIIAYIRTQPNRISTFAEALNGQLKAFATPRSWEMLSRTMFALEKANILESSIIKAAYGIVGTVGYEFAAFVKNTTKLIPPEDIVKDPKKARIPKVEEIDVLHATVSALEHYLVQHPKKWRESIIYALRLPMPELGLILAKHAFWVVVNKLEAKDKHNALQCPELAEMYSKWGGSLMPES